MDVVRIRDVERRMRVHVLVSEAAFIREFDAQDSDDRRLDHAHAFLRIVLLRAQDAIARRSDQSLREVASGRFRSDSQSCTQVQRNSTALESGTQLRENDPVLVRYQTVFPEGVAGRNQG